jgi:radical SAM protein with 4Fe4S-binding SPASM domain
MDCSSAPIQDSERAKPGHPLSVVTDWSVDPDEYGQFLSVVWDEWLKKDFGRIHVNLFETAIAQAAGLPAQTCTQAEFCGKGLAVEHDGEVYSCDHFVYPEYRLGNIAETHLGDMAFSADQEKFGMDKRDTLPKQCRECDYLQLCWGECPKNRLIKTKDGGLSVDNRDTYMAIRNQAEHKPEKGGATSYIHFDAKFRINNVRDLSEDDPTKAKPADIYKMHTYNEAIYGTVTSIILYPGKAPNEKKGEDAIYTKFTDLVPGVSALAVRPDKGATGNACSQRAIDTLKERLLKIIELIDSAAQDGLLEESRSHGDYLRMRHAETLGLPKD